MFPISKPSAHVANDITPDAALLHRWRWLDWLSPLGGLLLIVVMLLIPSVFKITGGLRQTLMFAFMWIGLASSWNLVGGYTGYIDFGHAVFFGVGGYTAGVLMANLLTWPFWLAASAAALVSAVFALAIGWPTLRLRGSYFAIAMLGTFVAVREITLNLKSITNGGEGISFSPPFLGPDAAYVLFLLLAGLAFFFSLLIYRSQFGQVLRAIRDDELATDMRGINTTKYKLGIFALAAALTGLLGATRAYQNAYIEVDIIFPLDMTVQIIMMVLLGGIGRPWGAVFGAILFEFGERVLWARYPEIHLIIIGGLLIFIVLIIPRGILGLLDPESRGLTWQVAALQTRHRQRDQNAVPLIPGTEQ